MTITFLEKERLARLFNFTELDDEEKTRRASLIRISFLTSFVGVLWSLLYIAIGIPKATTAVFSYVLLSFLNAMYFLLSKRYNHFRTIQLVLILFLPVSTQLTLGGFTSGSFVGLASMLSPLGAMMFHRAAVARYFFYGFIGVMVAVGIIELYVPDLGLVDLDKQTSLLFFVTNGVAISAVFYFLLEYFIKQKDLFQNLLKERNDEILEKNEELHMQREEITAQRDSLEEANSTLSKAFGQIQEQNTIIEKKNEDITASINYAQRIQQSMLPNDDLLSQAFDEHFVYFKPRDIVSGDFYWYGEAEGKQLIAAVDCTGHGVPGAFMSLIGNDLLTDIVTHRHITSPEKILELMDAGVRKTLRQETTNNRDGMDMTILAIDRKAGTMEFAGAKNPLIYIQDGHVEHVRGSRLSVGGHNHKMKNPELVFTKETIALKGTTFAYMFSDGYPDQFGGPKDRKFMVKNLRDVIEGMHSLPMTEQKTTLDWSLKEWQGKLPQIDDILVIGLKIEA